jgi:hypothetical protein
MIYKRLLRADRLRQIPPSFSWVDHRLVRDHHLERCGHSAWALYLFLLTVADAQGLSYYSDPSIGRSLKMAPTELALARQELVQADLIAYQKPLYQVLSLEPRSGPASPREKRLGQPASLGDILRRALEGGTP